jgi:hypothetical protein
MGLGLLGQNGSTINLFGLYVKLGAKQSVGVPWVQRLAQEWALVPHPFLSSKSGLSSM